MRITNDEEKPDSDDGLQEGSRSADDEVTFGKTLTQVASSEWSVPSQIGPYRLLQRIGSGGMGEVWVAEQSAPVKRRVALNSTATVHGTVAQVLEETREFPSGM